jgi:predicted nucleotidyltransferase
MDLSKPQRVISHPLDSTVLGVLAGTTRPLTGRQVARIAKDGSQQGIWKALTRLAEQGLLERQEAGNAVLYALNREHLAAPAVEVLAGMRRELIFRLEGAIGRWEIAPVHASLFGSAARGDGDSESDIDLLIVRPRQTDEEDPVWRDQVDALTVAVPRWTGNRAGVSEISEDDVDRLNRERPGVVEELRSDAVALFGPDVSKLFGWNR